MGALETCQIIKYKKYTATLHKTERKLLNNCTTTTDTIPQ